MRRMQALKPARKALMASLLSITWAAASASVMSLSPHGVQALVASQLFNRSGRWYLIDDGACRTYLEAPRTRLENDRLVLDAHLVARFGQRVGDLCAGADFASHVVVSGKLRAADHALILDDIRIDRVDDDNTRSALRLARQLVPDTVPRSAVIDVLDLLRRQFAPAGAWVVRVDQFHIVSVVSRVNSVSIGFDVGLSIQ